MPTTENRNPPLLVAVWPGMGQVALSAGFYLLVKLQMQELAEFPARELFDQEYVQVKNGLIHSPPLPRSRLYLWQDPAGKQDIVVFIGEAQPTGKEALCRKLIEFAKTKGIERIFTFASMATNMHPDERARVFGAATDKQGLDELRALDLQILQDGQIGGLNGLLLGVGIEYGLRGICLLGEIPHIFANLPCPKASLAVLEVFSTISGLRIDLSELFEHSKAMDQKLGEMLAEAERQLDRRSAPMQSTTAGSEFPESPEAGNRKLAPEAERRIEELFEQAKNDRSQAYELKLKLDELGAFRRYENRFLDLFKKKE